jgi:lipopolysaccharide/colanic/teichoic acid biosynthesis glycosyltransferase
VVKRLVDALLEAFVSVLIFPFKLLTWLLKKLVP